MGAAYLLKVMAMPRLLTALLLIALLAGCSRPARTPDAAPGVAAPAPGPAPAPASVAPPEAAPATPVPAPNPAEAGSPRDLNLAEMAGWLERHLNAGQGSAAPRLQALLRYWGLLPEAQPGGTALPVLPPAAADLDGDGQAEVVLALNHGAERHLGALYVAYYDGSRYRVNISLPPDLPGLAVHALADLTGDGRSEIVWSSADHGAHTGYIDLFVSTWMPGQIGTLPGAVHMNTPTQLRLEGREIALTGGLIGSAGAGAAQRPWTDRYRIVDGTLTRVDRQYEASDYAYHRLIDGIVAVDSGRPADAVAAYGDALDPQRQVLLPVALEPDQVAGLAEAVRAFARFRLGLLLTQQGRSTQARAVLAAADGPHAGLSEALRQAGDPDRGCQAARAWAETNPGFLAALNSAFGYANPRWQPADLCGALPGGI